MLTTIVLCAVLGAGPLERFAERNPASESIRSGDGKQLVHASGFLADLGVRRPVDAARAFLAADGRAFGVTAQQELQLVDAPEPGLVGEVRFQRAIAGLPVFGGDLVVGVDGSNRIFLVNTTEVAPATVGRHALQDGQATSLAMVSFDRPIQGAGPASVARGWKQVGSELRAVYRVDFAAERPSGQWRVYVDGETGRALLQLNLRISATAPGSVYEISPTETRAALCAIPAAGGARPTCASPSTLTLPDLTTEAELVGSQAAIYNCRGDNYPATVPGTCVAVPAVSGGFSFAPDTTWKDPTDNFAAVMAYYHINRHSAFLKGLDPALPSGRTGRALSGSLPGVVNAYEGGARLDNAYYSGGNTDAMIFGQGTAADFAYDGSIVYHEFTHGVVAAWGGFEESVDSTGALEEPAALDEGTADTLATSNTDRSEEGSFVEALSTPPAPYLRTMEDPTASRSCQGSGQVGTQVSFPGVINGLDGETHDDGEIWNGLYWEVYQGLKAANVKGCAGACEAGAVILYKTLKASAGTQPTLDTYWKTFKSQATLLFPARPAVATYVDCVARRRGFASCNRQVPVYAGESKAQYISKSWSPFQITVNVTGVGAKVEVCSLNGTAATLHGAIGKAVSIVPATRVVTSDRSVSGVPACSGGSASLSLDAVGTWYLLIDAPNAKEGSSFQPDRYKVKVLPTDVAARPAAPPLATCQFQVDPVVVAPATPTVAPGGSVTFTASGGTGTGWAWSIPTNPSGGTINGTTGAYVAGATGGVTDVVRVVDSLSNAATVTVTVTAPVVVAPATATVATGGSATFTASGGSGTGWAWSISSNASGGSINPTTGAYVAGATGGVTDVVRVVDSLSSAATASVTVTAPASGGGKGCSTSGGAELASLGVGLAFLLRRRRPG